MSRSWDRALAIANENAAKQNVRQRIFGWHDERLGWIYSTQMAFKHRRNLDKKPEVPEITISSQDEFRAHTAALPRCAQRARPSHGGQPKLAINDPKLARALARFLGAKFYRCDLPAPAIGQHWHLTTKYTGRIGC